MKKQMSISELILDENLYPRHKISSYNVSMMVEALQAGAKMPPIVVDAKTHKVIDGYHRVYAVKRIHGGSAKISVELRQYVNEKEMFRDAVRLNSKHGQNLTKWDKTRCLTFSKKFDIKLVDIIVDLNLTMETAKEMLKVRTATTVSGEAVSLKGSVSDLAGEKLTLEQAEFNAKQASGMKLTFHVNQVIKHLETKSTNLTEKVIDRLNILFEKLQEVLS